MKLPSAAFTPVRHGAGAPSQEGANRVEEQETFAPWRRKEDSTTINGGKELDGGNDANTESNTGLTEITDKTTIGSEKLE